MPVPMSAQSQPAGDGGAWLRFIAAELRQLRLELLEQQIVNESERLRTLERELGRLRVEQTQQNAEDNSRKQQAAQLEQQAEDANTDTQSRAQIIALKNDLLRAESESRQATNAMAVRAAEIAERMRASKARFQMLADRLRRSGPATP